MNIGLTFWSILLSFLWQSEVADSIGRTDSVVVGRNQAETPGVVNLLASFSSIKNKDKTSYLVFLAHCEWTKFKHSIIDNVMENIFGINR